MKINEVISPLKYYLATVRVVLHGASSTVRTTITADCASDARKLLAAIVGVGNVLNVSQIVTEAPQTDQIHREQAIRSKATQRRVQPRKVAQIQSSQVHQQRQQPQKRRVSARPIADPLKHKLIQDRLTKQFMRQSNIVKPTSDDIRVARDRAETALKRTDLDFKKRTEAKQRRQERQKNSSSVQADRQIDPTKKYLKGTSCRS